MKISKFILLYIISSFFLVFSLHANVKDRVIFAVTIYKFDKVKQNRIKRLGYKLIEEFNSKSDVNIEIMFIEDEFKVKKEFNEFKRYNSFVAYSTFFLENIDFFKENGKIPFIFADSENNLSQYYLVANKKSGIKTIADLKGKVLNSIVTTSYHQIWLDYLFLKEFKKTYKKIIKSEITEEKQNKKLLNVYFNKADFTVVSKSIYEDVILLNPSIINNLVIIKKSEPIFFYAIGAFHKDTPNHLTDMFISIVNNSEKNKDILSIYKLLGIHSVKALDFKDFDKLVNFYDEYLKLKEAY